MTQLAEIMNRKLITVDTRASLRQAQRMLDQLEMLVRGEETS